jgi:tetratricopeptide (TPR) repeat protein
MSENANNLLTPGGSLRPAPAPNVAPALSRPRRLEMVLASGLVLLVAGVLASFPARNSEVWRHLATGRALVTGSCGLGVDPFAYTTEGIAWVNHAWLYDVLLFTAYQGNGECLVGVKVLVVLALTVFVLLAAGLRESPWIAAVASAVAFVAMGPALILDSSVVSYLLFGFTLWWLRRSASAASPDWSLRMHLPLFLAFILWANCDEWFVLGLVTVGLFWLGTALQERGTGAQATGPTRLLLVFIVCVAVCLVNPFHAGVFRLPSALGTPTLRRLISWSWPDSPVALAAFAMLAVIGLRCLVAARLGQVIVFLALLGLSVYRRECVPFFAIAAAPLVARNWQAISARPSSARLRGFGALTAAAALLALAVLACPGWLQGPFERRGWFLHTDPSLQLMVQQLAEWHREGELGERRRGFAISTDAAHYVEWFCPEEKVFLDSRAQLFPPEVVTAFAQAAQTISAERPAALEEPAWIEARALLDRWGIGYTLIADPTDRRMANALRNLWQAPGEWSLVGLQGRAAVFARQTPLERRLKLTPVDLARRAFDPAVASRAPRQGPGREPEPRAWWDCFAWSDPAGTLDRDECIVDVTHFESLRGAYLQRHRTTWEAEATAALLGAVLPPRACGIHAVTGSLPLALLAASREPMDPARMTPLEILAYSMIVADAQKSDQGPPGSLLLAVRAGRRALHAEPDDPLTQLRLGRAYERLHRQTVERRSAAAFPLLEQLRKVQALVALQRAVRLRPDLLSGHELLAALYLEAKGYDLALPHVQAQLRLSKAAGPRPNESIQEFELRIEQLADHERKLGVHVRETLNLVDTQSFKLDVYARADLAQRSGLPGHALDQLKLSEYVNFGREGAILELHLLLHAGYTREVRSWFDPDWEPALGTFNYRWLQTILAATDGDYDEADEQLQRLIVPTVDLSELGRRNVRPGSALALLFGQQMLDGASIDSRQPVMHAVTGAPGRSPESQANFVRRLQSIAMIPRQEADLQTLRGVLALETGAIVPAQHAFRSALSAWNGDDGSAALARHYLALMREK